MAPSVRRRNHRDGPTNRSRQPVGTRQPIGRRTWLAPVLGVTIIVMLAAVASLAQATPEVFVAASLVFSLCEGVVLCFVGFSWSARGPYIAALAAALTAALAAPGRWEFAYVQYHQSMQPLDLALDALVSIAWGALAGLAGATILRPRLAALTHTDRDRFKGRS